MYYKVIKYTHGYWCFHVEYPHWSIYKCVLKWGLFGVTASFSVPNAPLFLLSNYEIVWCVKSQDGENIPLEKAIICELGSVGCCPPCQPLYLLCVNLTLCHLLVTYLYTNRGFYFVFILVVPSPGRYPVQQHQPFFLVLNLGRTFFSSTMKTRCLLLSRFPGIS